MINFEFQKNEKYVIIMSPEYWALKNKKCRVLDCGITNSDLGQDSKYCSMRPVVDWC